MKFPEPKRPTKIAAFSHSPSKVAVVKTTPQTVLDDIQHAMELAGMKYAMNKDATTILKDNISWHFPFPGSNTTPWQLEGSILGLHHQGFHDVVCVQNKTVVTDTFKGEDLNKYIPLITKYNIPVLFNFNDSDMKFQTTFLEKTYFTCPL